MARILWLILFFAALIWSGIEPKDRLTWWLEAAPALIAFLLLAATWRRFRLTPLVYWLILAHSLILLIGAHYTYADVPLFEHLAQLWGDGRNNFDKLGHLAQGFVPALIVRELLLRLTPLQQGGWLNTLVISTCLAISAVYELIEWWTALISEEAAEAFLGMQGYQWDTQSDMFYALVGAVAAVVFMSRLHDRQLRRLKQPANTP